MSTAMAVLPEAKLARPLKVLVPLIKEDIAQAETAGAEFYRAAGEKLQEARSQVPLGQFKQWLRENFAFSQSTAYKWMQLAGEIKLLRATNPDHPPARTMSEIVDKKRHPGHRPAWHKPVQQVINRVNVSALRKHFQDREAERKLQHQLGLELIDIGYKVLATKLHPDKGGSAEAMSRLNNVRDLLKGAL